MKHINSVTTISPEAQRSKTGTPVGEAGLPRQSSLEIGAWLAKQVPQDIDKAAASLALSRHGVRLAVEFQGRYPVGPNGESLPSYQAAVGCEIAGSDDQRAAALVDLRGFMTPAPIHAIEDWLAELSVLTAGRGREGFDAELAINAYSSRLAKFPADIARHVLLERSWKWFPAWEELETVCNTLTAPRRQMIAALSMPEPDPEPVRRPATKAEKAKIAELVRKKFPGTSTEWQDAAVREVTKGDCMTKVGA